jgi:hypothetical protein
MAKPLPTNLKILDAIYDRFYDDFTSFTKESPTRKAKVYVPVDLIEIAKDLQVDTDIVFGRLYYHLEPKYGRVLEESDDGSTRQPFFSIEIEEGKKCVNFPLLASVLADLREDARRHNSTSRVSWLSLAVSVAAILVSVVALYLGRS